MQSYQHFQTGGGVTLKVLSYNVLREIEKLKTEKADNDLSNVSSAGKAAAVSWGMPDWSAGIAYSQKNTEYTVPCAGYIIGYVSRSGTVRANLHIYVNDKSIGIVGADTPSNTFYFSFYTIVDKGDIFRTTVEGTDILGQDLYFYPMKGVSTNA